MKVLYFKTNTFALGKKFMMSLKKNKKKINIQKSNS